MNIKKVPALCLAALLAFSVAGCNKGTDGEENNGRDVTAEDAAVWCVDGSEQVLQGETYDVYDGEKGSSIALSAVRNEYETANIIVSAEKDLAFTVSVSDLTLSGDSSKKIASSNVAVYTQKYMAVNKTWHGGGASVGSYPDALIPQANAVAYKQNYVDAGNNGAAFLEFYIPETATAGTYTGTATVDLGLETVSVPISLTVYDYTLSSETHSKSLFTIGESNVILNERDNSDEILLKYADFLADYRLSTTTLPHDEESATAAEEFADLAYKYVAEKGMSTIGLPSAEGRNYNSYATIDIDYTAKYVVALAEKSLETGTDLISRCAFFNFWIDEPFYVSYPADAVNNAASVYDDMLELSVSEFTASDAYKSATGDKAEFAKQLADAIYKIPDIITDYYDDDHNYVTSGAATETDYDELNVSVAPKPDGYESAEYRAQYNTKFDDGTAREKWIYTCNTPSYPYVSYHLDDTLVSPTALGWMMGQYGITGNIYWSCVYWYDADTGAFLEDPYSSADHGSGALGDGSILYPGKIYGVDGPIGSTRLQAIRDGQEDYELIYALREMYEAKGKNADDAIDFAAKMITENGELTGGTSNYAAARKLLIELVLAADSNAQLMVDDISVVEENAEGMTEYTFTVSAADGATVSEGGETLTASGGVYTVAKTLAEDANYVELSASLGGETAAVTFYLGGRQSVYLAKDFAAGDIAADTALSSAYDSASGEWLLTYAAASAEGQLNSFTLKHSSLADIGANLSSYRLFVNAYETAGSYNVFAKYTGSGSYYSVASGTLAVGANEIVMTTFSTSYGSVEELVFEFDGAIVKLGIEKIVVYGG